MKIFIVDFSNSQELAQLLAPEHTVLEEKHDGAKAYQLIGAWMPDAILINVQQLPSHGKQTALAIKKRKKTAEIPLYFIGGSPINQEQLSGLGTIITKDDLSKIFGANH